MNITICCDDNDLTERLKDEVNDYFFSIRRICLMTLTSEEIEEEWNKKTYDCDLLMMCFETDDTRKKIKIIRKFKKYFPTYSLICISKENAEKNYYPELFELNLLYYIQENRLDELLPKALKLAVNKLHLFNDNCLICKSNHQMLKIPFDDIVYVEREMHTTKVFTEDNCYQIRRKLNELESVFEKYPAMIRCHMSFYVNYNYAVSFGNKKFEMKDGNIIPISRKYYQSVKERICDKDN